MRTVALTLTLCGGWLTAFGRLHTERDTRMDMKKVTLINAPVVDIVEELKRIEQAECTEGMRFND